MPTVLGQHRTHFDDVQVLWGLRSGPAGYTSLVDRIGDAYRTIEAIDRLLNRGRIRREMYCGTTYYERVEHG